MLPSPSPSLLLPVLIFLFFSPSVPFRLTTSLSLSHVFIATYIHTCVYVCRYIPRFFLFSVFSSLSLCRSTSLSLERAHKLEPDIRAQVCTHEIVKSCMRVSATCALHFLLAGQPSSFMRRARQRWNFTPFSAICHELFGTRR